MAQAAPGPLDAERDSASIASGRPLAGSGLRDGGCGILAGQDGVPERGA